LRADPGPGRGRAADGPYEFFVRGLSRAGTAGQAATKSFTI